jgi:hypothetical protein
MKYTVSQNSLLYWCQFDVLCTLHKYSLIAYYDLVTFPCMNLMSYVCSVCITLLPFLLRVLSRPILYFVYFIF